MVDTKIRIASYNIRKARGLDQKRSPERTIEVINQLNADIVVLQEADKRLGARMPAIPRQLIDNDTDFELVEMSESGISLGWHGNAVLVRENIQAESTKCLSLPGLEPRGAVVLGLSYGSDFDLIATHLGLMRRDRRLQLRTIAAATSEHKPSMITGDFNEWSRTKGMEPLQPHYNIHAPGRTFHARHPLGALDRFAHCNGVQMQDAGVLQSDLAKVASDHLPIWSDILIS